jgi:hypothetical protein
VNRRFANRIALLEERRRWVLEKIERHKSEGRPPNGWQVGEAAALQWAIEELRKLYPDLDVERQLERIIAQKTRRRA